MHNMAAGAATAPAAKLEVEEDGGEAGGVAPPRKREKAEPEGATTHAAAAGASVAAAKATAEQVERVGAAHTAAGAYVTTTARGGEPGHPTVAKRKKFLHPPRPPTNVDMQGCTEVRRLPGHDGRSVQATGVRLRWRFREDDQSCLVNTSENSMHLYILSQALPYKQQVGRVWCKER